MKLYCGIDLHSNNHWLTVIDEADQRIVERRLVNDLSLTLGTLEPYRSEITAIAVESTFNWYWLVDGLMEAGYTVKLVNTAAVRQYEGLKHSDDRHDAYHLAHLLRLGILPTGYIYPKQQRAIRDLLRQRTRLVQQRTLHVLTVKSAYARAMNLAVPTKILINAKQAPWPAVQDLHTAMAIDVHRPLIAALNVQIERIEKAVRSKLADTVLYRLLQSVAGIGPILAGVILLESGDIHRFKQVGNFTSYCRCVPAVRTSNEKKKGESNRKNGNPYLAWAFHEAAHTAIRCLPQAKRYYERKRQQRNGMLAMKATSHKLARAAYFIMHHEVAFEADRLFSY
jgi:transposase